MCTVKNFEIRQPKTGMLVERRFKNGVLPRNAQVAGVITKVYDGDLTWVDRGDLGRELVQVQWPDMHRETLSITYLRRMI